MKVVITGGAGFIGPATGAPPDPARRPDRTLRPLGKDRRHHLLRHGGCRTSGRPGWMSATRFVAGEIADRDDGEEAVRPAGSVGISPGLGGQRRRRAGFRPRHAGQSRRQPACAGIGARAGLEAAGGVRQLDRGVRRQERCRSRSATTTKQVPQTTYGMTKAIGELLVNDYSRKGFLDGRSAPPADRDHPPGQAEQGGLELRQRRVPRAAERRALRAAGRLRRGRCRWPAIAPSSKASSGCTRSDGASLGEDRAVSLPSLDVTVGDMVAGLKRVAGNRHLGEITRGERTRSSSGSSPAGPSARTFDRALRLGLPKDPDLDSIIKAYIEDFL